MIERLKKKFVILASVSAFVLMSVLVGIMNVINYSSVISEADTVLDILAQPNSPFGEMQEMPKKPPQDIREFIPRGMSPEVPYESRYFTVLISKDEKAERTDVSRIVSVDRSSAEAYAKQALESGRTRGFIGQFRFFKPTDGKMTQLVFLDCGRKLDSFRTFMGISIAVGLVGWLLVFIFLLLVSGRIVRPIAQSYEKQKRFITDAGHEIKTPLTVIGANLDLLEADFGENESISDVKAQVKRLASLTEELVYLSKMEESGNALAKVEFPVSDVILEAAQSFRAIAQTQKKDYRITVEPNLSMVGSPEDIRRLVVLLLDNAMKYSPLDGTVTLTANSSKKTLHISVFNTSAVPIASDALPRLFDRFYRLDASRNSETGGHGIGLSTAKAIANAHNGKIEAASLNGTDFLITVILPLS